MTDVAAGDRAVDLFRRLEGLRTDEPMLAQPMDRLFARIIDLATWLTLFFVTMTLANLLHIWIDGERLPGGEARLPEEQNVWINWGALFALTASIFLLETVPVARRGHNLAKRLLGMRVVDKDGNPPTFARASLRWVVLVVPPLACWLLVFSTLGSLWAWPFLALQLASFAIPLTILRHPEKRGIHDRVAGTWVVSKRG